MSKKMAIAAICVGAVVAMALPASASATWKHGKETPIQQNAKLGLTGDVSFTSPGQGSIQCKITSAIQLVAGQTTGFVDTFVADQTATSCITGGALAACQVHSIQATNLPWLFHTTVGTDHATLTAGELHGGLTGGFCPTQQVTVTPANYTVVPNFPIEVATVAWQGTAQVDSNLGKTAATVIGDLIVEFPDTHTYSI